MLEKERPIVALDHPQKPKRVHHPSRNSLMLSLKKGDLKLHFYSYLDSEIMNKLLEKYCYDQSL